VPPTPPISPHRWLPCPRSTNCPYCSRDNSGIAKNAQRGDVRTTKTGSRPTEPAAKMSGGTTRSSSASSSSALHPNLIDVARSTCEPLPMIGPRDSSACWSPTDRLFGLYGQAKASFTRFWNS
jgi:ribosomal protein L44E